LGQPVAGSLSPFIHQAFAEQHHLKLEYQVAETGVAELAGRLAEWAAAGASGINLTLPLKEEGFRLCNGQTRAAARSRAVNVLIRAGQGWIGDNTDGIGFWKDLTRRHRFLSQGRPILVVGSGGAARGILQTLIEAGEVVCLAVRDRGRGMRLVDDFAWMGAQRILVTDLRTPPAGTRWSLIVNATSAGHSGQIPDLDPGIFEGRPWAYDLGYGEAGRPFTRWAMERGAARAIDGLGMLVEQAAASFEKWTGRIPLTDPVYDALRLQSP
jgi:shikimate dehydrogenase